MPSTWQLLISAVMKCALSNIVIVIAQKQILNNNSIFYGIMCCTYYSNVTQFGKEKKK